MRIILVTLLFLGTLSTGIWSPAGAWDLTKDKVGFIISGSHQDEQYGWTREETYKNLIPNNLLHNNIPLLRANPRYILNYGGAYRFMIVKKADSAIKAGSGGGLWSNYRATDWSDLKSLIQSGQWHICNGWLTEADVLIPTAESLIRQGLYGNGFNEDNFGKVSTECVLPDCFGFGYTLPTILRHTGMRGFHTHKFRNWGGWWSVSGDMSIHKWYGPDSSFIYSSLTAVDHWSSPTVNTGDGNGVFNKCGLWITCAISGTGDNGGANDAGRVTQLTGPADAQINGAHAFWAGSDSMFNQLNALETSRPDIMSKMGAYDGEDILRTHGTGCYTAMADVKVRHRQAEINGISAEPAAVMANALAQTPYPRAALTSAWIKTLCHEFHDDVTGTSVNNAYYTSAVDASVPDLDAQILAFSNVRASSNVAAMQKLNTQVASGSVPVVVYNPIGMNRRDPVEVDVAFSAAPAAVQVLDPAGVEIPSQIVSKNGNTARVLFVADVPSIGYAVYEVKPVAQASAFSTGVSAPSATTLQNNYYTVTIDNVGDISQIQDKVLNKNLFAKESRWEMRNDASSGYPAWEINYADVASAPREVVDQSVVATVLENGPVRATIQVTRSRAGSTFKHLYRLYADSAGRRVVVDNNFTWNTNNTLLKGGFYLTASNATATFGQGIGTIDRPNMSTVRYEVPAQQWAAITNSDGTFGTAIMNMYKYGWSKMANNSLHLTFIHTPMDIGGNYKGDKYQHSFSYGIYSYSGNWRNGVENQTHRFNIPLIAVATTAHAAGTPFTNQKRYSLVMPDDPSKVQIMAVKFAEKSDDVVVRVRELNGLRSDVSLVFSHAIASWKEVNGCEKDVASPTTVTGAGTKLSFAIKRNQLRTFKITLGQFVSDNTGSNGRALSLAAKREVTIGLAGRGKAGRVKLTLGASEMIRKVYLSDIKGSMIAMIVKNPLPLAGSSTIVWNGNGRNNKNVPAGIYIVNIVTDRGAAFVPMTIVR